MMWSAMRVALRSTQLNPHAGEVDSAFRSNAAEQSAVL